MKHPRRNRISIFKSKLKRGTIMTPIKDQINSIIANRKLLLPKINERLNLLAILQNDIGELNNNIKLLKSKEGLPDDIRQICDNFEHNSINDNISDSIEALKQLEKRYNRSTINIGVAGQARVGKSTFLQTLSGLTDTQIPTGSGLPVTATRSRIFNSLSKRAIVTFYSEYDFFHIVIKSFFDELDLTNLPQTIEDFENYIFPEKIDLAPKKADLLDRLKKIQKAIFSFKDYLNKGEQEFQLEDIKPFVAYPTKDEEYKEDCKRPYLAVKDVRIECPFPENDVENLGIMDLPGLGENVPKQYMNSFMNYKSEVDLVVLLTRPTDAKAFFDETDIDALDCANIAKGAIKDKSDYALIVINNGGLEDEANILENDITNRLNKNKDGVKYNILKGNVKDPNDLRDNITSKILEHLAESLPRMDSDYEEDSIKKINKILVDGDKLLKRVKIDIEKKLKGDNQINILVKKANKLSKDCAVSFNDLLESYEEKSDEIHDFINEVENHYSNLEEWIEKGLGYDSPEEWKKEAKREIALGASPLKLIQDEFNRIRNHISKSYSKIDDFMNDKVNLLCNDISKCLKENTGVLVDEELGRVYLEKFKERCDNTLEECLTMREAINTILDSKIEYRSHFHPLVRQNIKSLKPHIDNIGEDIEVIFNHLSDLATRVNSETRKSLCKEAKIGNLIINSWLEDFDDRFIRDVHSDDEFRNLVESYKELIWPEEFVFSYKSELNKINKISEISLMHLDNLRSL